MLSLNLLSPQEKTASLLLWKYLIIKNVIMIVLTLSIVIAVVLFGAKLVLMQKLAEVQIQTELTNISQNKINQKINFYNDQIKTIEQIQKNYVVWSDLLYLFNRLITEGITLQKTNFDINENMITVSGIADTRDNLLNFKNNLESCELMTNVTLPLNTLLKKQDIDFTITADLTTTDISDLDCLNTSE